MKNNEAAMAYFKSMPKKEFAPNPYYTFDDEVGICYTGITSLAFDVKSWLLTLTVVREYFRRVFESFGTESQVLLVSQDDAEKLRQVCLPEITTEDGLHFSGIRVAIFVLPQINTPVNSSVSEKCWQQYIVGNNIIPVARIHSHHILDAYQSTTDYSTLNSGSLEMVLGHITGDEFYVAYWLDEKGKPTKENVYLATGDVDGFNVKKIASGKPLK